MAWLRAQLRRDCLDQMELAYEDRPFFQTEDQVLSIIQFEIQSHLLPKSHIFSLLIDKCININ